MAKDELHGAVASEAVAERLAAEALIVDVDGFEGPLDLLLTLSRTQKVDLRKISVLQLAEQYLAFVERAKSLRIELAADYLVMAARRDIKAVRRIVARMVPSVLWELGVSDEEDPTWVLSDISWSTDPDDWEAARWELAKTILDEAG